MLHHLWPKFSKVSAISFQNSILNLVHSAETLTLPWDISTKNHIVIFNIYVKESEGSDLGLKTQNSPNAFKTTPVWVSLFTI